MHVRFGYLLSSLIIVNLLGVCFGPGPVHAVHDQGPAHVYILAGQSNMNGNDTFPDYVLDHLAAMSPNVSLYWRDYDENREEGTLPETGYQSGIHASYRGPDFFGPELGFGYMMSTVHPGEKVMLIKYARGATQISENRDDGRGTWHPGVNADSPKGENYEKLHETIDDVLAHLVNSGYQPAIEGMVWMQGEHDAEKSRAEGEAYFYNFMRFLRRMREDINHPTLPVVFGRINAPLKTFRNQVRASQQLVDKIVPNTAMVNTDDLGFVDSIHYDASGMWNLGWRFADQMLNMETEMPEPPMGPLDFLKYQVPESSDFVLLNELSIDNQVDYSAYWTGYPSYPDYTVNLMDDLDEPFDRFAYAMVLDDNGAYGKRFVWVSADPFSDDPNDLAVPVDGPIQQRLSHTNMYTDHPDLADHLETADPYTEMFGIATDAALTTAYRIGSPDGVLEFAPSNYYAPCEWGNLPCLGNSNDVRDYNDSGFNYSDGYGSMQIHNVPDTLFAYNRWGGGNTCDLGIGNSTGTNSDWTFKKNCSQYSEKKLYTFVQKSTLDHIPEAAGYTRVLSIDLPTDANWDAAEDIPYALNRAAELAGSRVQRLAFYLELADENGTKFIWTSMDAFTQDLQEAGIPAEWTFDSPVSNLTVVSDHPQISNVYNASGGRIEFWPGQYDEEPNSLYDHDDTQRANTKRYGSMQVHRGSQTLWAYNRWASGNNVLLDEEGDPLALSPMPLDGLGIGEQTSGHPDWTFSETAGNYYVRKLQVFAKLDPYAVPLIPDSYGFQMVYDIVLPATAAWSRTSDIPYLTDNSGLLDGVDVDKIAYELQLDGHYIWTSMDAFTQNTSLMGIPVDGGFDVSVRGVTVVTNHPNVDNAYDKDGGNIEFWSNCYQKGANGIFDYDDIVSVTQDCYGSMQVHLDGETQWAYNRFADSPGSPPRVGDLGIGDRQSITQQAHPDWTFAFNAELYNYRRLRVFIKRD